VFLVLNISITAGNNKIMVSSTDTHINTWASIKPTLKDEEVALNSIFKVG
jgi:hypothetical protein